MNDITKRTQEELAAAAEIKRLNELTTSMGEEIVDLRNAYEEQVTEIERLKLENDVLRGENKVLRGENERLRMAVGGRYKP